MHTHLIDWFRNLHINPDPAVVEKRWSLAEAYLEKMSRGQIPRLIRIFLFAPQDLAEVKGFAAELLALDKEFPVTGNTEEVRLMAGVVMVASFDSSQNGDAFAMGLRSAAFPGRKLEPVLPAIISEAEEYLASEAGKVRPIHFNQVPASSEAALATAYKKMKEAEAADDASEKPKAQAAYQKAIAKAIQDSHSTLANQVKRLSEETALLWWVLSEYSTSLKRRTAEMSPVSYSLAAASEAADRTHVMPPPSCSNELLIRALKPCEVGAVSTFPIAEFLTAADNEWRVALLKKIDIAGVTDLVPLLLCLAKYQEFGDADSAIKVIPRLCPGFTTERRLSPEEASHQFYAELMFLKALALAGND